MKKRVITVKNKKQSLLTNLRDEGVALSAVCGGHGTCGRCKVRFLHEAPPACEGERLLLSEKEIKEGVRLACLTYVQGSFEIELVEDPEEEMDVAGNEMADRRIGDEIPASNCAVAVDLGTTTIAAALIDTKNKRIVGIRTGMNHQRAYGADVLSRIDAANRGEGEQLRKLVRKDILSLCGQLGAGDALPSSSIPVFISGNTTMEHLLQGLSCESLGIFPFTPVDISFHTFENMTILPGISTFVGADIVSGIVALEIDQREEISILVDLGTNGEMAIGNRDRILVTSAAAGPAFEGGNIRCGMPGIPGAIDTVQIRGGEVRFTTIGHKPGEDKEAAAPRGLCGTGVIETVYELVKEEIVDETGLLADPYFETGFPLTKEILFAAEDVREVQLAKAAIRAGIEILLMEYGVRCDQVDRLYLAGGFGQKMNCEKAVGIGLLPAGLSGKMTAVGNTSLQGAAMLAMEPELMKRFIRIPETAKEIVLANHGRFHDLYLEHMFF